MRRTIMALTALGLSVSNPVAAEESRSAWIAVDQDSESVALQIFAALDVGETGSFKLISRKSGKSGSATSQQAGQIGLGNGDVSGPFSTSRFSLRSGEKMEAEFGKPFGNRTTSLKRTQFAQASSPSWTRKTRYPSKHPLLANRSVERTVLASSKPQSVLKCRTSGGVCNSRTFQFQSATKVCKLATPALSVRADNPTRISRSVTRTSPPSIYPSSITRTF